MHFPSLMYASLTLFAQGVIRHLVLGFLLHLSFLTPLTIPHILQPSIFLLLFNKSPVPPLYSLSNPIFREAPLELEKSQLNVRGRATVVIVGSLPELHKTSSSMLGVLHHLGALDFVVTRSNYIKKQLRVRGSYTTLNQLYSDQAFLVT
jgi:hypothetical protein